MSYCKYDALDCFHTEIEILSECNHPNVIKIKSANFDGTVVKELVRNQTPAPLQHVSRELNKLMSEQSNASSDYSEGTSILKRQSKVCYYVMKLAEYGELYRIIETNERLSEDLIRHLFA
jgi:serine/threonine protein kinase